MSTILLSLLVNKNIFLCSIVNSLKKKKNVGFFTTSFNIFGNLAIMHFLDVVMTCIIWFLGCVVVVMSYTQVIMS